MAINCPHCRKSIGGAATDGGSRLRVGIVLIDDNGDVHGPCPHCKEDVPIVADGKLSKALGGRTVVPGLRVVRR